MHTHTTTKEKLYENINNSQKMQIIAFYSFYNALYCFSNIIFPDLHIYSQDIIYHASVKFYCSFLITYKYNKNFAYVFINNYYVESMFLIIL